MRVLSPPVQCAEGTATWTWNARYDTGETVPGGSYTYYLWGYDNLGPGVRASRNAVADTENNPPRLIEEEYRGNPLASPVLWSKDRKWVLGGDPDDTSLLETCSIPVPDGYTLGRYMCPGGYSWPERFIVGIGHTADHRHGAAAYQWVPNGVAVLETPWGDNGLALAEGLWAGGTAEAGVASENMNGYLFSVDGVHSDPEAGTSLWIWNIVDGTIIRRIDLSSWWNRPEDARNGGQLNGGPNSISIRDGRLYLNGSFSCLAQALEPFMEEEADLVAWANGNGDGVLDRNYSPDSPHPWVCSDSAAGPFLPDLAADNRQFALASIDGPGSSFGLLAPDGTGVGTFSFAGETPGAKKIDFICDNDSAFDGIYFENGDASGLWHVARDCFKGHLELDWKDSVDIDSPAAFTVAQNSPNPFNPSTTISFTLAKAGKTTVDVYNIAGQKVATLMSGNLSAGAHSVTWNAASASAGVYFYTVRSSGFSKTMKMTLLK